ncbi:hypothetical protein [Streptomyces sp. Ru87]|uniref:hypothetical protein n=1 Tax=Streptomyces sp. Ru87 TaxID=2044307 RepID=UPI000BF636D9|nr:hypothetical protein [Streptomyces sp. Ru87]PGH49937.1 hypothetical protein CRI70_14820 [Streptomyces sp. Ru87]
MKDYHDLYESYASAYADKSQEVLVDVAAAGQATTDMLRYTLVRLINHLAGCGCQVWLPPGPILEALTGDWEAADLVQDLTDVTGHPLRAADIMALGMLQDWPCFADVTAEDLEDEGAPDADA